MMSKKHLTTLTGLVLAASFALTGCGANAQSSPSADAATAAPKFPAGDVINDGKGDYQLAGVADNDPINSVDLVKVDAATLNTFTRDDIQQAQKLVGSYISEAIDSPMRLPDYQPDGRRTPAMNQVESDYEKRLVSKYFIPGYLIDDAAKRRDGSNTTDPNQGTTPYNHPGIEITDAGIENHDQAAFSAAFSYDYGKDKQRVISRTMTVLSVYANTAATESTLGNKSYQAPKVDIGPRLEMKVDVVYGVRALLDGTAILESQHDIARINLVKQQGKMVISDANFDEYKQ